MDICSKPGSKEAYRGGLEVIIMNALSVAAHQMFSEPTGELRKYNSIDINHCGAIAIIAFCCGWRYLFAMMNVEYLPSANARFARFRLARMRSGPAPIQPGRVAFLVNRTLIGLK